jgi:Flp pilus assembly protein TadD
MRLGDEARARKLLEASFEADPFNVRVSNTIKVLEVLDDYDSLETEHFIVRFDPKYDRLLAKYAAAWLEEQYPLLCKQFGFEPPGKSLFEIFNRARNTDGHGWFSARMVGLPHIHTIGACAGQMVAMQAPTEGNRFNWARVLKHEFIHVLNLQQTNFNIPHWFTEALATLNEGYPRPKQWNDLLVSRLAGKKLFTLDTINLGFIRARNGDEWNLAYCQAELYAEFMIARFGADALAKMLAAYADNLNTSAAIERSFGIDQAEFERLYQQYIAEVVARLPKASQEEEMSPAALDKELRANPKNPGLLARSARVALDRKDYALARRQADAALRTDSKNQLAAYVRARLYLLLGETKPAVELLVTTLDETQPQPNLLGLLAGLRLKSQDYAEAAKLYELGAKVDPTDTKWSKALASVYLKAKQPEKLKPVLARLAEIDADDFTIRKKLAELSLAEKDYAAAERWAREANQIDVQNADVHRRLAEALEARGQSAAAAEERSIAKELADGQL